MSTKPLEGFTLFQTTGGWQLSVRKEGQEGWSVYKHYPEAAAEEILDVIQRRLPSLPERTPLSQPRRERVRL